MAREKKEYELSCSDFRPDCNFTVRAETVEEVLDQCQKHACTAHWKCTDSPEMRKRIRSRIREVWR